MIHPTAIIDEAVRETLPEDISIGAYAVIESDVSIGPGCSIGHHAVIKGPTRIGTGNRIFQFASIGEEPQDLKFHGEPTQLIIGDRNTFREFTTINRGTVSGIGRTEIGSDNLLMAYVHVAHDCIVGNHVIFSNSASLAGHVEVMDHAILSGFTLVHQFCNIGEHAFTGMGTALNRDLPPYVIASGNYARPIGINKEGLKRRGFTPELIQALHNAFRLMIKSRKRDETAIAELVDKWPEVARFKSFIDNSQRGIIR